MKIFGIDETLEGLKRGAEKFGTRIAAAVVKKMRTRVNGFTPKGVECKTCGKKFDNPADGLDHRNKTGHDTRDLENGFAPKESEPYGLGMGGSDTEQMSQPVNNDIPPAKLRQQNKLEFLLKELPLASEAEEKRIIQAEIESLQKELSEFPPSGDPDARREKDSTTGGGRDSKLNSVCDLCEGRGGAGAPKNPWSSRGWEMVCPQCGGTGKFENEDSANLGFQSAQKTTTAQREKENAGICSSCQHPSDSHMAGTGKPFPGGVRCEEPGCKCTAPKHLANANACAGGDHKWSPEGTCKECGAKWDDPLVKNADAQSKCPACGYESPEGWDGKCDACGVENAEDVGGNLSHKPKNLIKENGELDALNHVLDGRCTKCNKAYQRMSTNPADYCPIGASALEKKNAKRGEEKFWPFKGNEGGALEEAYIGSEVHDGEGWWKVVEVKKDGLRVKFLRNASGSRCIKCDKSLPIDQMVKNEHGAGYLCTADAKEWNAENGLGATCSQCGKWTDDAFMGPDGKLTCKACVRKENASGQTYTFQDINDERVVVQATDEAGAWEKLSEDYGTPLFELKKMGIELISVRKNEKQNADGYVYTFKDSQGEETKVLSSSESNAWEQLANEFATPIADLKKMGIQLVARRENEKQNAPGDHAWDTGSPKRRREWLKLAGIFDTSLATREWAELKDEPGVLGKLMDASTKGGMDYVMSNAAVDPTCKCDHSNYSAAACDCAASGCKCPECAKLQSELDNGQDEYGSVCDGCRATADQEGLKHVKGQLLCRECAARNGVSADEWHSKKAVKNSSNPTEIARSLILGGATPRVLLELLREKVPGIPDDQLQASISAAYRRLSIDPGSIENSVTIDEVSMELTGKKYRELPDDGPAQDSVIHEYEKRGGKMPLENAGHLDATGWELMDLEGRRNWLIASGMDQELAYYRFVDLSEDVKEALSNLRDKEAIGARSNAGHLGPDAWSAASTEEKIQWLEAAGQDINEATRAWDNLSADLHVALQAEFDRPKSINNARPFRCTCGGTIEAVPGQEDRYECNDCGQLYEKDDWRADRLKAVNSKDNAGTIHFTFGDAGNREAACGGWVNPGTKNYPLSEVNCPKCLEDLSGEKQNATNTTKCPSCGGKLIRSGDSYGCTSCGEEFREGELLTNAGPECSQCDHDKSKHKNGSGHCRICACPEFVSSLKNADQASDLEEIARHAEGIEHEVEELAEARQSIDPKDRLNAGLTRGSKYGNRNNATFATGDRVKSDVDAQGMKRGELGTITDLAEQNTAFGGFTVYEVKLDSGKTVSVRNGHLVLSKA